MYEIQNLFEEIELAPNSKRVELYDLLDYDKIIVSSSGGKDSLAAVLYLLDLGIPRKNIVLWHQCVDGGESLMDWPVTEEYVKIMGQALGIAVEYQWRDLGFYGELMKTESLSNPVKFTFGEDVITLPSIRGVPNTRRKFPMKAPDIRRRWCSGILKIDVFRRCLNNHPAYREGKFLVITGERREESPNRARYLDQELHPCNTKKRSVHWWRNVIEWKEAKIWDIIEKHRVNPHPAYLLGWNRTSCFGCIFQTPDLWHMMRDIAPERFRQLANLEQELGFTIDTNYSLDQMADMGKSRIPKRQETSQWIQTALNGGFTVDDFFVDKWELPAGAFHGTQGGAY